MRPGNIETKACNGRYVLQNRKINACCKVILRVPKWTQLGNIANNNSN